MDIQPQDGWTHKREGYGVNIFPGSQPYKVKDTNDARWQDAVAYVREDNDSVILVRPLSDFLAKFERAKELDEG